MQGTIGRNVSEWMKKKNVEIVLLSILSSFSFLSVLFSNFWEIFFREKKYGRSEV